jgi:hypothetical protein
MNTAGFGSLRHLGERFVMSLSPLPPSVADEAWAIRWLNPGERDVWARQSNADRRHAIGVARTVASSLGDADGSGVAREVLAAALLHDVGKIVCGLGTFARVGVTVVASLLGRDAVAAWAGGPGSTSSAAGAVSAPARAWKRRAGLYVTHDRLGADLLVAAGSAPFTVTWTRAHHQPEETWTLDPALTAVLKAADGD